MQRQILNRAWETTTVNIKIPARESLGYYITHGSTKPGSSWVAAHPDEGLSLGEKRKKKTP
jgi:hypothetical protein